MSSLVQVIGLMPICTAMFVLTLSLFGRRQRRDRIGSRCAARFAATHPGGERFCLPTQRIEKYRIAIRRPEESAILGIARAECLDAADIAERIAAAKRDQRGAAARQAWPMPVRSPRRHTRRGIEANELLAAEPADLVEFVHAHVDEDATAAGLELCGWRFAIPLVAVEAIKLAELAGHDAPAQVLQRGHEAAPVGDLEFHAVTFGNRGGLTRVFRGDAAWFLAQYRQAGSGDLSDQGQDAACWAQQSARHQCPPRAASQPYRHEVQGRNRARRREPCPMVRRQRPHAPCRYPTEPSDARVPCGQPRQGQAGIAGCMPLPTADQCLPAPNIRRNRPGVSGGGSISADSSCATLPGIPRKKSNALMVRRFASS